MFGPWGYRSVPKQQECQDSERAAVQRRRWKVRVCVRAGGWHHLQEKITADGERIGQYSYIDNDGKTITVKYTAGKDGFRILEGDHVPRGATGLESAAFDPEVAAQGSLFP